MKLSNNQQAFLELVKAGLWEKDACLLPYGDIDFQEIYRLAQEQAVVGLIAAGLEHVADLKPPKDMLLMFVGEALQLEQRNTAMNYFIGVLIEKMRNAEIYTLLVKGQGIAQCYERPLWRACGDIDLFLSEDNYKKAEQYLIPLTSSYEEEDSYTRHRSLIITPWEVELHGTMRPALWKRIDKTVDEVQNDVFLGGAVRSWMNEKTQVFLPRADEDIVFVLSHILQHFFKEGIGLRQICDLCRLLWTYRESIQIDLLDARLKKAGIKTEWNVFASLAVNYLGMPQEAVPLFSQNRKWSEKANRLLSFIYDSGNFGHNRDRSYLSERPLFERKIMSFKRHTLDLACQLRIFPWDTIKVGGRIMIKGLWFAFKGK